MNRVIVLSSLCSLCLVSSASALDAELTKPYQLQIVLHFIDHPQITGAYRDRVKQDLGDAVQAALGDLGSVTVVTDHPRLRDVLQNGLQATLDSWKERSGIKTHFVLVRFNGFDWEIEARQHDGITGQASLFTGQIVRREKTRDRDFVGRQAALMICRDFGLIATPVGDPYDNDHVKIAIKGAGLGVSLGPWVKKDEVFGLVGIAADGKSETVFPWLFLRVEKEPVDGVCVCRIFFRHVNPLGNSRYAGVGFRCVKLGTVRGPVRLHITQKGTKSATEALSILVRRFAFSGEADAFTETQRSDGYFDTAHRGPDFFFNHLALVTVNGSGSAVRIPKLPVPILSDEPLEVVFDAEGEDLFQIREMYKQWTRRVNDSYLVQANLFKRLNEMTGTPEQRKEALVEANAGLERSRADYNRRIAERKELDDEIQKIKTPANRPCIAKWDSLLKSMKTNEGELVNYIKGIEESLQILNDPQRVKWLAEISRARLLEQKYEYGQAIAIYENARKVKSLDNAELRDRIAKLRAVWDKGNSDRKLEAARQFIYTDLPKLAKFSEVKAKLGDIKQAFAECKRAGDWLGAQKMVEGMLPLREVIERESKDLKPRLTKEDEDLLKEIAEVTEELGKLEVELNAFLKMTAPK